MDFLYKWKLNIQWLPVHVGSINSLVLRKKICLIHFHRGSNFKLVVLSWISNEHFSQVWFQMVLWLHRRIVFPNTIISPIVIPHWHNLCELMSLSYNLHVLIYWGLSWSWSYGSWIYNYLCNQCLSPITLWRVRIRLRWDVLDTILFVSDLRQVTGFLRILQFPPSIKLIQQRRL